MNVIVIGAGVIGAACAEEIVSRGHHVHVIDVRGPGRGASQASAGVLAPFIEAHDGEPLLDLTVESLALYDAFIARLRERSGCAIEYARTGTLEVALSEEDETRLSDLKKWLDLRGVESSWLTGAALSRFEPTVASGARGALMISAHGFVSVPNLISALVQSARLQGATFESPVGAARIEPRKDRVEVVLGDEACRTLTADIVVLAAGSWSGRIRVASAPALDVKPIRGQLLHLGWPDAAESPLPQRIVWGPRCYTVPWANGTLLVGATSEDVGFDERTTVEGVNALLSAVHELLPASHAAEIKDIRVGLRPASGTGQPIIGPMAHAPRVIAATGHFRNGVMLAPLTAARVAEMLP